MKLDLNQQNLQAQMNRLSEIAKGGTGTQNTQSVNNSQSTNQFGNLLGDAVNKVNQYQMQASQAASQIESGDGGTSLVKAVIASQKASVAFQATMQVRNKVVSAYQDIMNMPI